MRLIPGAILVTWFFGYSSIAVSAITVTVEPDDYPDDTLLNTVSPFVTLSGEFHGSAKFDVYSASQNSIQELAHALASTGTKVFAYDHVHSFNGRPYLRMDFSQPVSSVSIDFGASNTFATPHQGEMYAYSAAGFTVGSYLAGNVPALQHETMTVSGDGIAYAIAYAGYDTYGSLDHLVFTIPTPEPSTLILTAIGGLAMRRRRGT